MADKDVENGCVSEKTEFIPKLGLGDEKVAPNDTNRNDHEVKSGKCCKCCTRKCCCIGTSVVVVIVGAVLLGMYLYYKKKMADAMEGGASSEDSDLWAKRFSEGAGGSGAIAGDYQLKSYTPSYEQYLGALGVPSFVISLMIGAKETVTIKEPEEEGGYFTLITKTAFLEVEKKFKIGEEFHFVWGRNKGTMYSVCTMPNPYTLSFKTRERERDWDITSVMEFSKFGMVNTRTFVNEGIEAKKFYQRVGAEYDDSATSIYNNADVVQIDNSPEEEEEEEASEEDLFGDTSDDFFKQSQDVDLGGDIFEDDDF